MTENQELLETILGQNVSRETFSRLETYEALLAKWQGTINLVGPGTIPQMWERHFLDSAQIAHLIPEGAKTLFDLGSGAGFPGMVLAILNPALEVHLIESDQRKCAFLSTVSRETKTPVTIHNERIESLKEGAFPVPDVITARALAALAELLEYALPFAQKKTALQLVFLKGAQVEKELADARKRFSFTVENFPSRTDKEGAVLRLSGLCIKEGQDARKS